MYLAGPLSPHIRRVADCTLCYLQVTLCFFYMCTCHVCICIPCNVQHIYLYILYAYICIDDCKVCIYYIILYMTYLRSFVNTSFVNTSFVNTKSVSAGRQKLQDLQGWELQRKQIPPYSHRKILSDPCCCTMTLQMSTCS